MTAACACIIIPSAPIIRNREPTLTEGWRYALTHGFSLRRLLHPLFYAATLIAPCPIHVWGNSECH